jgi:hypothetical protein
VSESTQGYPQCDLVARTGGGVVKVDVIVDSGPQPFPRLERTVEEAAQVFGGPRLVAAPEHVPRLGLDGDWFPARDAVMSSDGVRLITTTVVDWKGGSQGRQETLAVAVTRPFLGPLRKKLAEYGES